MLYFVEAESDDKVMLMSCEVDALCVHVDAESFL